MTEENKNYGAEQIQVLEGLEAVRKRPGMYIGSTSSRGLHHLVWEIVDNSIDEHLAGHGNKIELTIHTDNSISVKDYGRGIPVGMHSTGKPTVEVVLTVLHAGGKFGGDNSGYKTSGGLHGVGSSCVNALSEQMSAVVRLDGKLHKIEFERGDTVKELTVIGDAEEGDTGTTIWYKPDPLIFKETLVYDYKTICNRLRESAMLNPGLEIIITDERQVTEETGEFAQTRYFFEGGIRDFVSFVNRTKKPLHEDIFYVSEKYIHTEKVKVINEKTHKEEEIEKEETYQVDVAFQYCEDSYSSKDGIFSYTNNIRTPEGGSHEAGFKSALTQCLKDFITTRDLIKVKNKKEKEKEMPGGEDMRTGITAIISVKVPDPQFEGQTKSKLGNSEVRSIVDEVVKKALTRFLEEYPKTSEKIVGKIIDSFEERMAARKARMDKRNRKKSGTSTGKPKKMADCSSKNPAEKELYIVEGDSAGGSAKQGRDRFFQAILPLRGKIINCEKNKEDKVLSNNEVDEILLALGTGFGEEFDYENLQFHKVVIMTDADVDGEHIAILLLTFFYRYVRPLIERGHIYMAKPPLFKVQQGKKIQYAYNDQELDTMLSELPVQPKPGIQRYKGLGEMNPSQLWETTMDPAERTLDRVTLEDAIEAEMYVRMLMGDDSELRKEFIAENSHKATIDA